MNYYQLSIIDYDWSLLFVVIIIIRISGTKRKEECETTVEDVDYQLE